MPRSQRPRSAALRVVATVATLGALAAPAAADDGDDRGAITATLNFAMGSGGVGDAKGFIAPGGHFDVGFRVRRWRLAAELDTGLWSNPSAPDERPESGGFTRGGVALRWNLMDRVIPRRGERPRAAYRIYVESGLGRQRVHAPGIALSRNDVMLGLGVAPELSLGKALVGVNFGLRVLVANAPDDEVARSTCGDCRAPVRHDLTLLYVFGFTFGR